MVGREKPNILVVGTPGVGKSTVCSAIAQHSGLQHVELSRVIQDNKLYKEWDDEMNCSIFDEDMVCTFLEEELANGNTVVEFHCCDFMDPSLFDAVFVLRSENGILFKRLEQRRYPEKKIRENVECEIFQVILDEAVETFGEDMVTELQNNTIEDLNTNMLRIREEIKKQEILLANETTS